MTPETLRQVIWEITLALKLCCASPLVGPVRLEVAMYENARLSTCHRIIESKFTSRRVARKAFHCARYFGQLQDTHTP